MTEAKERTRKVKMLNQPKKGWLAHTLFLAAVMLLGASGWVSAGPVLDDQEERPLVVERIENGFVIAPDFKFTEVDGRFANLAGVQAGWLMDKRLFVGGAAHWLTNRSPDLEMAYGGAVVEWFALPDHPVNVSIRGLVGAGSGTLGIDLGDFAGLSRRRRGRVGDGRVILPTVALVREGFLVAEPQVNAFFRLNRRFRLGLGAGYRLIGAARELGDRFRGGSATLSLQFGSF